jgi:hypothetical protein
LNTLQTRMATAAGGNLSGLPMYPTVFGGMRAASPATAGNAAGSVANLLDAAIDVTWSVDYARNANTVCHTCFNAIADGAVRVIRSAMLSTHLSGVPRTQNVREFHHLCCRTPACAAGELVGLDALREEDRACVERTVA